MGTVNRMYHFLTSSRCIPHKGSANSIMSVVGRRNPGSETLPKRLAFERVEEIRDPKRGRRGVTDSISSGLVGYS